MSDLTFNEYNDNDVDPDKYIGRRIKSVSFKDNVLSLVFEDKVTIEISDQGQQCCEHRYMTCDDNIQDLVGQVLKKILVKNVTHGRERDDESGAERPDTAFLEIQTNTNSVGFATHNEHNGYYSGFRLIIEEVEQFS